MSLRIGEVSRKTSETDIRVRINLDGTGNCNPYSWGKKTFNEDDIWVVFMLYLKKKKTSRQLL